MLKFNKQKENQKIILIAGKYIKEIGILESEKLELETEINKINRVLELLSENLIFNNKVSTFDIYRKADKEFKEQISLCKSIKKDVVYISQTMDESNLNVNNHLKGDVKNILWQLDPLSRKKLNSWSKMLLEKNASELQLDIREIKFNDDNYVECLLPDDIIKAYSEDLNLDKKKIELKSKIKTLKMVKQELEQLYLAMLPNNDIVKN